jgi:hypothetical protein
MINTIEQMQEILKQQRAYQGYELLEPFCITIKGEAIFKAKCLKCGDIFFVAYSDVSQGFVSGCYECELPTRKHYRQSTKGQICGRVTVIDVIRYHKDRIPYLLLGCTCGNFSLTTHLVSSCGCYRLEQIRKAKVEDLTGKVFNRLTPIKIVQVDKPGTWWLCSCSCGKETIVRCDRLKNGDIRSCGCMVKDINGNRMRTHGESRTRLYQIWRNMIYRCYDPQNIYYKNYGGRGININSDWQKDFLNFKNWALANGYKETLTIDRINNDGNYEPNNCRWATHKEQIDNQRRDCRYKKRT